MLAASSDDISFSVPLLIAAGAAGVVWLTLLGAIAISRRAPRVRPAPAGMDLPPEPPAIAGLLADDFRVPGETAPAIVLDLAARRVLELEEVQPGRTVCRLRTRHDEALSPSEQRVLDTLRAKAIDGIVPAEALTTGQAHESTSWHRGLAKDVVTEAQHAGLTRDRWSRATLTASFVGAWVIGVLLFLAYQIGGDVGFRKSGESFGGDDRLTTGGIGAGVGLFAIAIGVSVLSRWLRSLDQLPTPEGLTAASRVRGLAAHLREDGMLTELPPAAVAVRGRHFAYAAAFGVAPLAVALLPMGEEDDHRAWSRFGGRWRRVRVAYPRGWPPGWGKHPAFAALLALFWGAIAALAIRGLAAAADSDRPSSIAPDQWDWLEVASLIAMVPFLFVLLWSLWVLVCAVADLFQSHTVTGEIVRSRRRSQWFGSSSDNPKYWYYLGVDDGSAERVRAWRVRQGLWQGCRQGATVTAVITTRLRYVRSVDTS